MKCNLNTMVTLATALLGALAAAYIAFPAAQAFILASAPLLVALVCTVWMIVMMLTMRGHGASATAGAPKVDVSSAPKTPAVARRA
jgi:hypothetical protein